MVFLLPQNTGIPFIKDITLAVVENKILAQAFSKSFSNSFFVYVISILSNSS